MKSGQPCKQKPASRPSGQVEALYLHVPFCRAKCRYCDFYSLPLEESAALAYVEAAAAELRAHQHHLARPLESVFLGGGTPTVLGPELLGRLLSLCSPLVGPRTEVTAEANPGTIDAAVVEALTAGKVNRASLGAQSFLPEELALLGRIHRVEQIAQAVTLLRSAGIGNISLDLIYGIPGQTMATWRQSLQQALGLQVDHLSCYALSFEEGTALAADLRAGTVHDMDEELQRDCYYAAIEAAAAAGMEHYEISNFARPGRRCRHNLTYWHNLPYLGIGPAAASYVGGIRRTNRPDLRQYVQALQAGQAPPADCEQLTGRALMAETMMLGLRLIEGVHRDDFAARFGADPVAAFPQSLGRYQQQGLLAVTPTHVRLASDAIFVADAILADIVDEGGTG